MSHERRDSERIAISFTAVCRREGEAWEARISNISLGGCCLELPWKVLERGDRIALELNDEIVLPATVAWAGTKRAGLAFTNPIYGSMVAEFAEQAARAA